MSARNARIVAGVIQKDTPLPKSVVGAFNPDIIIPGMQLRRGARRAREEREEIPADDKELPEDEDFEEGEGC